MRRVVAALSSAFLFSFAPVPVHADGPPAVAERDGTMTVQTVGYRSRYYRNSTVRRSGTGYTPWYLLPKTDPRRFNGPRYYWK